MKAIETVSRRGEDLAPFKPHFTGRSRGSVALDQWRGLALMLVLISHGFLYTNRVWGAGRVGVNLFFFISGILVYRSLNKSDSNSWHLTSSFWWRRSRRLYPALVAYVGIMFVAGIFLQRLPSLPAGSDMGTYIRALPWALSYMTNYVHGSPMSLAHLWSVSCEMQFYTLAPVIFLMGRGPRLRGVVVYGGIASVLIGIGIVVPLQAQHLGMTRYHFEVAVWPMMLGFLAEFRKKWLLKCPRRIVTTIFRLGIAAFILSVMVMPFGIQMKRPVVALGASVLLSCLCGYLFELPFPGQVGRFLAWTGERTYSIYLWQQPFTICNFLPLFAQPIGAAFSIVVGACSFSMFERPFMSETRVRQLPLLEQGELVSNKL